MTDNTVKTRYVMHDCGSTGLKSHWRPRRGCAPDRSITNDIGGV
jgi:hypothetical protein